MYIQKNWRESIELVGSLAKYFTQKSIRIIYLSNERGDAKEDNNNNETTEEAYWYRTE